MHEPFLGTKVNIFQHLRAEKSCFVSGFSLPVKRLIKWCKAGRYDITGDGIIDEEDLKLLRQEEIVKYILQPYYWNRWRADKIKQARRAFLNMICIDRPANRRFLKG